jgi:2-polyprenyl-3-methyl-5-hydroxy-6-metoxy-1,4-benzoquinol methylase
MHNRAGTDVDWSTVEKQFQTLGKRDLPSRIPFLLENIKKEDNILEIGCSSGFLLNNLKDKGYKCTGFEPSEIYSDFCKKNGIDCISDYNELDKYLDKFDIILHYYVLEHVADPVMFINHLLKYLKKGGKMIFEIPHVDDPLIKLFNVPAFQKFYWTIVHHWYFNRKSISYILDKINNITYELLPKQRYDISNHITWMLEGKPGGLGKYNHIFSDETIKNYEKDLIDNWLCDTIVVVCQKK